MEIKWYVRNSRLMVKLQDIPSSFCNHGHPESLNYVLALTEGGILLPELDETFAEVFGSVVNVLGAHLYSPGTATIIAPYRDINNGLSILSSRGLERVIYLRFFEVTFARIGEDGLSLIRYEGDPPSWRGADNFFSSPGFVRVAKDVSL